MIGISSGQMVELERGILARRKAEIISALRNEFPAVASGLDELSLARFVQQTMTACRTGWIDEAPHILRAARIGFVLEFVRPNKTRQRYFGRILASEETAESRLRFAEENLLDR